MSHRRRGDSVAGAETDEHLDVAAGGGHVDLGILRLEAHEREVGAGGIVDGLGIEVVAEDPAGDDPSLWGVVVASDAESSHQVVSRVVFAQWSMIDGILVEADDYSGL
jgi:hypothetical protein